ncbi:MAG: 4-hydroxy-2-oxovalerate aldolase, partial [Elusimicrobiota bacterium]
MPSSIQPLKNRDIAFGGWTSLGHSSITEMLSKSGVGFIGIDLEHSTISLEQSQSIIATAQAAGLVCYPRVSSHNYE